MLHPHEQFIKAPPGGGVHKEKQFGSAKPGILFPTQPGSSVKSRVLMVVCQSVENTKKIRLLTK